MKLRLARKRVDPLKTRAARKIIRAIERWIRKHSFLWVSYPRWYVGVTRNATARQLAHAKKNRQPPVFWQCWYASSRSVALAIEKYFHQKGMLDFAHSGNTKSDTYYIYVYKKYPLFA